MPESREARSSRTPSEQLLEGLKDSMLGPNQRMSGQAAAKARAVSSSPPPKSLAGLFLSVLAVVVAVSGVLAWSGELDGAAGFSALVSDVATLRRTPWSAQDNIAAAVAFVLSLFVLVAIDLLVCARVCRDTGARWFLLHALGNLIVAVAAIPDFLNAARDPVMSISVAYCRDIRGATSGAFSIATCSDLPTCLIIGMHVYHMLAFHLNAEDMWHHIVFVPIVGAIHFLYPFGASGNILCFFISGFPGGLDYLMLAAVKSGRLASFTEKRINCSINTWIRGPGMTFHCSLAFFCWLKPAAGTPPEHLMPGWLMVMVGVVVFFNGQFYAQRVIGNYYIRKQEEHTKRGLKGPVDLHAS